MTKQFHIGPDGPGDCSAVKKKCPYGGESGKENHFSTKKEAEEHFAKQMEKEGNKISGNSEYGEKFKNVPDEMKDFVRRKAEEIGIAIGDKTKASTTYADLYHPEHDTAVTLYFDERRPDIVSARFDYSTHIETLENDYLKDIEDANTQKEAITTLKTLHADVVKKANSLGYDFAFSHGTGDGSSGYYDAVIPKGKWNEQEFEKLWSAADKYYKEYIEILDDNELN